MWKEHKDNEWIKSKMQGRSGCYGYNKINGPARIGYIYKKSKLVVFYYNVVLFVRYLKRKIKNDN